MVSSISEATQVIHRYVSNEFVPKVGIVLGSGLSALADQMTHPISIPYQALPGLQEGHVLGHASVLLLGYLDQVPIACLRGRLHRYEGVTYEAICTLIRIIRYLGCHTLLITCAAGSLHPNILPGELMLVTDHINFQPGNPLVGSNDESIGPRFIGLEDAYDLELQDQFLKVAKRLDILVHQGVYVCTLGPSFETPAEIRAFQRLGADLVGMSLVPEVIVARHCGLRVIAISVITNLAAGLNKEKITHESALHIGELTVRKLDKLIPNFLHTLTEGK